MAERTVLLDATAEAPTWDVAHLVCLDETGSTTNLLRRYGQGAHDDQFPAGYVRHSRTDCSGQEGFSGVGREGRDGHVPRREVAVVV